MLIRFIFRSSHMFPHLVSKEIYAIKCMFPYGSNITCYLMQLSIIVSFLKYDITSLQSLILTCSRIKFNQFYSNNIARHQQNSFQYITVTSYERHKSPRTRSFDQQLVQASNKENNNHLIDDPLWGESIGDQLFPHKGPICSDVTMW